MIKFLIFLVVLLTGLVIARIVRITELVSQLSGENEAEVTRKDNSFNGRMMMFFLIATIAFFAYTTIKYSVYVLPVSASEHGVGIDKMLNINFAIIIFVFFVTQILLFYYAFRYSHKEENRATFYPDNHKIEIWWTVIPAVVLIALVVYGLSQWNKITGAAPKDAMVIELYAKQFDWTARYTGNDHKLGKSNFRMIEGSNVLGMDVNDKNGDDDIITKDLHLPVNTPILLVMHSRDVIHSAYLPHFRVQMNCVPGMTTQFHFTPTITTEQMKGITKDDKFEYVLLCNKICGVAHFTMKMNVVCETKEQFAEWLKKQKTFSETISAQAAVTGGASAMIVSK